MRIGRVIVSLLGLLLTGVAAALAQTGENAAVRVVAPARIAMGSATLPAYLSADWTRPLPAVTRAVIAVHGAARNADVYLRSVEAARDAAGVAAETVLLIVPQFLTQADIGAHGLPADAVRWTPEAWKDGRPALGPAPLSSFEALDAILGRLADKAVFPGLRRVVVAGHSAGAQLVQRYAVAGKGETVLTARGVRVRYAVANPSSYLWFGDLRLAAPDTRACPGLDRWKYGLTEPPPYVGAVDDLEMRYINRDVVYLLGEADNDPNHPSLDRSCAAMAQGTTRYARGMQYMFHLELRHPNLVRHALFSVPGVAHDNAAMFASVCGMAALFDSAGCVGF